MNRLSEIYEDISNSGVIIFNQPFQFSDINTKAVVTEQNSCYGLFIDNSRIDCTAEELCIVAHEAGHIMTGSTHALYSKYDTIGRHEYRAKRWAIKKLVPKDELEAAVNNGYTEPWELAELFGVTQQFMEEAMQYYKYASE